MQISWLDRVDSTQRFLLDALRTHTLQPPVCVAAREQYSGKGSRGNRWEGLEGNLFFSFAVRRSELPDDLRLESASIYFTFLLKSLLADKGSQVWLKWPNDFYLGERKIGGAITNLHGDVLVCGIGINLKHAPEGFGTLDIEVEPNLLLGSYFELFRKKLPWKQIFSNYQLEFDRSRAYWAHAGESRISLEEAELLEDGSIACQGQRIFSLR